MNSVNKKTEATRPSARQDAWVLMDATPKPGKSRYYLKFQDKDVFEPAPVEQSEDMPTQAPWRSQSLLSLRQRKQVRSKSQTDEGATHAQSNTLLELKCAEARLKLRAISAIAKEVQQLRECISDDGYAAACNISCIAQRALMQLRPPLSPLPFSPPSPTFQNGFCAEDEEAVFF